MNQHRGSQERTSRGSPRATARKRGVVRKKRKEVEASVPARTQSPGLVARTSITQLQKSSGGVLASNKLGYALQKERQCRVNGGLAFD
jgi:hypothetical protein